MNLRYTRREDSTGLETCLNVQGKEMERESETKSRLLVGEPGWLRCHFSETSDLEERSWVRKRETILTRSFCGAMGFKI